MQQFDGPKPEGDPEFKSRLTASGPHADVKVSAEWPETPPGVPMLLLLDTKVEIPPEGKMEKDLRLLTYTNWGYISRLSKQQRLL